jgi:hypothetical protein
LGISEPFLARLEAGAVAHPFRGVARRRVLVLAALLCATDRQVRAYLRAAELSPLTPDETRFVARITGALAARQTPCPTLLPPRPPRLFGREAELSRLVDAITVRPFGIYAITGIPGVGKTALACEALHLLAEHHNPSFPNGFVSFSCVGRHGVSGLLSLLEDITAVLAAPTSLVSAPDASEESRLAQVTNRLRTILAGRCVALLLDGLEPDFPWRGACAALRVWGGEERAGADNLGQGQGQQLIVTTSHFIPPCGLSAYHLALEPLAPEAALRVLADALNRPLEGEEIGHAWRLCAALGYTPLAIEAAATAITTRRLPLTVIADAATRDPLGAALGGDTELRAQLNRPIAALAPSTRAWYAALSSLGGAFGLEAAARQSDATRDLLDQSELNDTTMRAMAALGDLAQRSLIAIEPVVPAGIAQGDVCCREAPFHAVRYRLDPLLRACAGDTLLGLGAAATREARKRTLRYALEYVEEHDGNPKAIEREARVVLAALEYAWQNRDYARVARLAAGLEPLLLRVATVAEGKRVSWRAALSARALGNRAAVADWLDSVGVMRFMLGETKEARRAFDEATDLADELGVVTHALGNLAQLAYDCGAHTEAERLLERQRQRYETAGYLFGAAFSRVRAAAYARWGGDEVRAGAEMAAADGLLASSRAAEGTDQYLALLLLEARAEMARMRHDYDAAEVGSESACAYAAVSCDNTTVARFRLEQADYAWSVGDAERATQLATQALHVAAPLGAHTLERRALDLRRRVSSRAKWSQL